MMLHGGHGAAWRRRQRRLRSRWRHEQQTVAAVLATVTHRSHPKVGTANDAPRGQKTVTSTRVEPAEYYELSSDDGRPTGGERPGALLEPWPQGQVQRHAGIGYELVQALDAPVLQMVEQFPDAHHFFATCLPVVAEQVDHPREHPLRDACVASRSWRNSWWKCRRSYPLLLSLRGLAIPVPGGGGRNAGLQGPRTEFNSDFFFIGTHF